MKKTILSSFLLFFLILLFASLSLFSKIGTLNISDKEIFNYIVYNMRLTRCLNAIFCGAILALCGLIFQCVFKNPMADSYILGVSSGASLFVALSYFFSFTLFSTTIWALTGSLLTSFILFSFNKRDTYQLLLCGIAANFFLSAASTLIVYLSKKKIDSALYWTMGSFSDTSITKTAVAALTLLILLFVCYKNCQKMDILLMDDATAISCGVNIKKEKIILLAFASAATSICVASCGIIGFVGLMSPHIMRNITGPKHSKLILPSMLFGSFILIFSDYVSRLIIYPSELPVGLVTSVLGAPVFFVILKRGFYR